MKIDFRSLWKKILNPPTWVKVLTFIITIISAIGALLMLLVDYDGNALAIIAYTLFGIAGLSLTYSVYLVIPLFPKMKAGIMSFLESYEFTRLLLRNFGFRTVIFAIGSFLMSLLFSGFNAYMGIANRSIWYGALAAFYIALAFIRGGILGYHKNKVSKKIKTQNDEYIKANVGKNTNLTITNSNIINAYGGNNLTGTISGTLNTIVNSGNITNLYGGGNAADALSDAFVTINGGTIKESLYGGGKEANINNTKITINDVVKIKNLYGGGYSGDVLKSSTIITNDGTIENLYGGGYAGHILIDSN